MRIGRSFDVPLSFKGLHLASECSRMRSNGVGEVAHAHWTVVDDLAQDCDRRHTNRDARTNGNQSIETLASCNATQRAHFIA
jgi:hypothetical protein